MEEEVPMQAPEPTRGMPELTPERNMEEQERSSFGEVFGAVADNDWYATAAWRAVMDRAPNIEDPDFDPTDEEVVRSVAEEYDVPPEYFDRFYDTVSLEHMQHVAGRIRTELENEETIRNARLGSRLALNMMDPVGLALSTVSGGASAAAKAGQAGRASMLLRGAAAGAVVEGLGETARVKTTETQGAVDILFATALGAGFGMLGSSARNLSDFESGLLSKVIRDIDADAHAVQNGEGFGESSAGAAQVPRETTIDWESTFREESPAPTGGFLRGDLANRLGNETMPDPVRYLGSILVQDAGGTRQGGAAVRTGAEEIKTRVVQSEVSQVLRRAWPEFEAWRKNNKLRDTQENRQMFFSRVSRAQRREPGSGIPEIEDPNVHKAAQAYQEMYRRIGSAAQREGIPGFEDIDTGGLYVNRLLDGQHFRDMANKFGKDTIIRLIRAGIRGGDNSGLGGDALQEVAENYFRVVSNLDRGTFRKLRSADPDSAKRMFADAIREDPNIGIKDDDAINQVLDMIIGQSKGADSPRGKARLSMDETVSLRLEDGRHLFVDDLFENDANALMMNYLNSVAGWVSVAQASGGKIRSRADFETAMSHVGKEVDVYPGFNKGKSDEAQKVLQRLFDHITGTPLHDNPEWVDATVDLISKYNFTRLMGQTGFSQGAELGVAMSSFGFRGMLQNIPELKKLYGDFKKGKMDDEVLVELQSIFPFGNTQLRSKLGVRLERTAEVSGESRDNAMFAGPREFFRKASNVTAKVSGLAPITDALQLMGVRAYIGKLAYRAAKGKPLMSERRAASLGISPEDMPRVTEALQQIAEVDTGVLGAPKLNKLDFANADDIEAADLIVNAVYKEMTRTIQETSLGATRMALTSPLARVMLQFQNFMLTSYTKHLQYGMSVKDAEVFQEFMASLLMASLAYTARTYTRSVGRENAQEYLDENLKVEKIAATSFYYSTQVSIIPNLVDASAYSMGLPRVFAGARTSGMATGYDFPMLEAQRSMRQAVGGSARAAVDPDYRFSETQARAFARIMPFQNTVPLMIAQNIAFSESDLPRDSD